MNSFTAALHYTLSRHIIFKIFSHAVHALVVTIDRYVVNVTVLRCVICSNCRSYVQGEFLQYHWIVYHVNPTLGVTKTATYNGVQSGLYDTCSKHSKPSKSIGSSTISINTNTDRCYVAFSVKWQSRLWRIVDVEFTVTETLMSFNDKSSRTFRRITFHKRQHVYWCDFRCSTLFNNVTLLRP